MGVVGRDSQRLTEEAESGGTGGESLSYQILKRANPEERRSDLASQPECRPVPSRPF